MAVLAKQLQNVVSFVANPKMYFHKKCSCLKSAIIGHWSRLFGHLKVCRIVCMLATLSAALSVSQFRETHFSLFMNEWVIFRLTFITFNAAKCCVVRWWWSYSNQFSIWQTVAICSVVLLQLLLLQIVCSISLPLCSCLRPL